MWGLSRTLVDNMVDRRHQGLRADARAGRRRLSRGDEGPGALPCSSASATTSTSRRRPASPSPCRKQTEIKITGIDKQLVGETAARIRRIRPPEPYKGKGVRYAGEEGPPQGRQEEVGHGAFLPRYQHKRAQRTRTRLEELANGRPRLSVFRSSKNIYAQVIDDRARRDPGRRLVAGRRQGRQRAPTRTPPPASARWSPNAPSKRASRTWSSIAAAIIYHGRVKALADAAREAGLNF